MLPLPRPVTSMEQRYVRSCVNAWEEARAIFAPTCADGLSLFAPGDIICSMNKFLVKLIITAATVSAE